MKLTTLERITVLGILPAEGSLVTQRILGKLKAALSFTEAELKELELKELEGRITWNPTKEPEGGTEIEIGEKATDVILTALKKLDKEEKLVAQHLSVCDKFKLGEAV